MEAEVNTDPIFAAIDTHKEAVAKFNAAHAKAVEEGLNDVNGQSAQATFSATLETGATLVAMTPTTVAGLQSLESYLREDIMLQRCIKRPTIMKGLAFASSEGSVEWLISKRAAEIGIAA
jgi:hypothetical protein